MRFFIFIVLFSFGSDCCFGQDSTVNLSASMFDLNQAIVLFNLNGWHFRQGNDPAWARPDLNTTGWKSMKPTEISKKLADKNGRIEGWFRLKIRLDSSFDGMPLFLDVFSWGAADLYVDGKLFRSYGNTGIKGQTFTGTVPSTNRPLSFIHLVLGKEHLIAIHFVNYIRSFPLNLIAGEYLWLQPLLNGPIFTPNNYDFFHELAIYEIIWTTVCIILSLLFWLLIFQNPRQRNLRLIAFCSTCFALSTLLRYIEDQNGDILLPSFLTISIIESLFTVLMVTSTLLILACVFTNKASRRLVILLSLITIIAFYDRLISNSPTVLIICMAAVIVIALYYVISSWKTLKGAQWAIVAGVLITLFWVFLWVILTLLKIEALPARINYPFLIVEAGIYLSFPFSLLVYVSLRFREIIRDVRENARKVVEVTEEKRQQALNQQTILKEQVKERTAELSQSLENLKATQSQLIQSEKMASLGELTAGIAHEIQNPLNFVNNFSEVNTELIEEADQEIDKGNISEVKTILNDIKENEEKINHHGKRADAIVKGMLQHSRSSSGVKEPTDINALADEYLRLAYHGLRAKDKTFNATMKTDYDQSIGTINIVPQDIGRVILNLITNAFYAVTEKKNQQTESFEPTVTVSTKRINSKAEIKVRDNGNGIPQKILDKIFQPFFTTKPTGQGTGLGLSLSYDIVKGHGGELNVDTKEGEYTEFTILLSL
jgi:two-component system, NtrC family, sensor kinase